jgi:hypothetical protein
MRVPGVEDDRREFAEFYAAARDDCLQVVLISLGDRLPGRADDRAPAAGSASTPGSMWCCARAGA